MTIKEFFKQSPEAIKEAAGCSSAKEFEKLAGKIGITFDNNEDLEKAFDLVKKQSNGELTDEDLDAVSGGKASVSGGRYFKSENVFVDPKGNVFTRGTGKKA